jgi:general secretion pathway protein L
VTVWALLRTRGSTWIDDVAAGLARLSAMLRRSRKIELVEQADGSFLVVDTSKQAAERADGPSLRVEEGGFADPISPQAQSLLARTSVDVMLAPSHFIFRSLELPGAASQFLDGVVRSQIDRLTPWSANEAAFGWSEPTEAANGQIAITVAATARSLVAPIARAVMAARADHVRMSTWIGEGATQMIPIFAEDIGGETGGQGLRRRVVAGLALSGLAFAISLGAWLIAGWGDDARIADLQNRIAERRSELMNRRGPAAEEALKALEARKWATPSAVMTLESLSKTLPDDAHLTEMRIEGGKVQIAGSATDASALIRLIEQSRRFTEATFFAPTVRTANGAESFHIEAHIDPLFPRRIDANRNP